MSWVVSERFLKCSAQVEHALQLCLLVLALAFQCAWAQPVAAPQESGANDLAASAPRAAGTGSTLEQKGEATPPAPATSIEALGQRIDALAKAVESATSAAKPPAVDPWQDAKSVVLNIVSSRLDSWLFGDGKGSVGFAAQIVAVLAFSIALIRFMVAVALLDPATPPTRWGRFKAWTRRHWVVRAINAVVGLLAVLFTGAALYVITAARAAPDISQASITALQESLTACQASLRQTPPSLPQQPPPPQQQLPPPQPSDGSSAALAAMAQYSQSCERAIQAADARLVQIEASVAGIADKQPWTLTKIVAFLAWVYLLVAVTYLFARRLAR